MESNNNGCKGGEAEPKTKHIKKNKAENMSKRESSASKSSTNHAHKSEQGTPSISKGQKQHNCFETDREKGGGVDEAEEPEADDEKRPADPEAKPYPQPEPITNAVDIYKPPTSDRLTIKDIINNNKTGVPAKSELLSSKLKSEKGSKSSKSQLDAFNMNESKPLLSNVVNSAQQEIVELPKSTMFHKRIIIVDGKPQIDQSSLVIESSQLRNEEDNPDNFQIINEGDEVRNSSLIYARRSHTKKWSAEETEFFYKCLKECGTDFSMIESRFEGKRNRTQIKNKFRKEESENSSRIEETLYGPKYNSSPMKKRESKEELKNLDDM